MFNRQTLTLPFEIVADGRGGVVEATVVPDQDPRQFGLHLIFPDVAVQKFEGFPMCEAHVKSRGSGYASMFGWIQLFKTGETEWEMDPIPVLNDVNTPFAWFGPEPTLFDAPIRMGIQYIDWSCHSFLVHLPDGLMTKNVFPILGFEWGFEMRDGKVQITALKQLGSEWNSHLGILRAKYPGWKFAEQKVAQA